MRILQINKSHGHMGGANRYYLELSRALAEDGHKVIHFSAQGARDEPSPYRRHFVTPVDFRRPGPLNRKILSSLRVLYSMEARKKIGEVISRYHPEIAHIHNIYHHLSPSILPLLKDRGIPVVMTAHDYKLVCPSYTMFDGYGVCERCLGGKAYRVLRGRCQRNARRKGLVLFLEAYPHWFPRTYERCGDVVTAPSRFLKRVLDESPLSLKKVVAVPNFADPIPEESAG